MFETGPQLSMVLLTIYKLNMNEEVGKVIIVAKQVADTM